MKLVRGLALALLAACMPWSAFADDVTITNNDGMFISNAAQTNLSLGGSTLFGVQGLGTGFDCGGGPPACSGTLTLKTGALLTGPGNGAGTLVPTTGETSMFGPGGMFDVTENMQNGLKGFTFDGTFSSESWSCATGFTCASNAKGTKYTGTWTLVGSVVNGVLTIGGQTIDIAQAATVQLTTVSGTVNYVKGQALSFVDKGGPTTFPSPVPEPSTLSLFGSGLIAIGLLTKRLGSRPSVSPLE